MYNMRRWPLSRNRPKSDVSCWAKKVWKPKECATPATICILRFLFTTRLSILFFHALCFKRSIYGNHISEVPVGMSLFDRNNFIFALYLRPPIERYFSKHERFVLDECQSVPSSASLLLRGTEWISFTPIFFSTMSAYLQITPHVRILAYWMKVTKINILIKDYQS